MNSYDYEEGDRVDYVYGSLKGVGAIRGVAANAVPVLGKHYIVENLNGIIDEVHYPFSCISIPEIHLTYLK